MEIKEKGKEYEIYVNDEKHCFEIKRLRDWKTVDSFYDFEKAQEKLDKLNKE